MKALRFTLIFLLTAAVLLAILSPSLLGGILPKDVVDLVRMDEFPLLGTCSRIAAGLIDTLGGGGILTFEIVTNALGDNFLDELLSLLMVAVLSIPVSMILGALLYRPLYKGLLMRGLLYVSLNLVSVLIAWVLYRQFYFRLLIEGLITKSINDQTLQNVLNYLTQLLSAAAIGAIAIKVAVAFMAAKIMIHKIIFPVIGTLIRTLLFAFLTALMLLWRANPAAWTLILPVMAVTLVVSGISDGLFGS